PLAGGTPTGYPKFSAADAMAQNLKDGGFDLCLTANIHCMDKGHKGLVRTLDVLDEVGLAHVGTSRTQEEHDNNVVLADVGGISVAFLGYTYGTNALALPKDAPYAANVYNRDYMTTLADPDYDYLLQGLETAKALQPDLIAVLIHWGIEYKLTQSRLQEEVADFLFENGADLVLGGHPHVIQPLGFRELPDGRQGFISYSLGNFFSSQTQENTDVTALLSLELTRDNNTGETQVTGCSYVPMLMHRTARRSGFSLLDAYAALNAGVEDPELEQRLLGAIDLCHQVLGEEYDPLA
ncbi:MAG: CapA family protein, partial [Oscillospiraceae bacterium]|nr:CapA family protein [Oscillospiraceae bacterium]